MNPLKKVLTVMGASLALSLPGMASPPIPANDVPTANVGKGIYTASCNLMGCHVGPASGDPQGIFAGENPYFLDQIANSSPGQYPAPMVSALKSLTPAQKDAVALYLASQDSKNYTLKGQAMRINPVVGVANATITVQSDYLTGKSLFFPDVVVQTDSQGKYSIQTWPGRKVISIKHPTVAFSPSVINQVELTSEVAGWGTYQQFGTSDMVTGAGNTMAVTLSGENFLAPALSILFKNPQVSKVLPWLITSPTPKP
jgi:hypothetical protein